MLNPAFLSKENYPKTEAFIGIRNTANRLQTLDIGKMYMNNTKVARIISTKNISVSPEIKPYEITEKNDALTIVNLWNDPHITLSQSINQFDMAVMDAVYTIITNGHLIFTAEQLARVLSGDMSQNATDAKIRKIKNSINKLRYIHIKIDASDEFNTKKNKEKEQFVFEGYLLPIESLEIKYSANGKKAVAYEVLTVPALYRYAEILNQIISIPLDLFNTKEYFNDTDEKILIKRYVLKRIFQMKAHNRMYSDKISFQWQGKSGEMKGLYAELGYTPNNSNKWRQTTKPMIKKVVENTLRSLKDKGIISSYTEYREDGTRNPASPIAGYEITMNTGKSTK